MDLPWEEHDVARERRARLHAERRLEQKEKELRAANRKLSAHALMLSSQVIDQRRTVETLQSERSQVSRDLQLATEKAMNVERLMWAALESMRDGFAVFDRNHRLIAANENYLSITEGSDAIDIGSGFEDILDFCLDEGVFDLEGEDEDVWFERMKNRWSDERISPVVLKFFDNRYIRLVDRHTSEGGIVSLALDITDTIRKEQDLRQARDRARAADRAKSTFLAKMSHELRTPMNGVVGMADLLLEDEEDIERRLFIETIKSSGEALLQIINDILDFSKIEADRLDLTPVEFDLEKLLQEISLIVGPAVKQKGLSLQIDYDQFLPTRFIADAGRIRQVITNLVGNAVKFTERGHILIRVLGIAADDQDATDITFTVEDTGIGIEPDKIDHIFGEFNQIEDASNRKFEGTGLGLAITRGLIEHMGGTVWVESVKGEGSCFGFRLKLDSAGRDLPVRQGREHNLRAATLLCPDPLDQQKLVRQLESIGLPTRCVSDLPDFPAGPPRQDDLFLVSVDFEAEVEIPGHLIWIGRPKEEAPAIQRPYLTSSLLALIDQLEGSQTSSPDAASAEANGSATPARPLIVLAAEDNRTNQLVFRKMVKDLNIKLFMVANGVEAVETFESDSPDLVFMDISMPEMDGLEATKRIRAREKEKQLDPVEIIAMTAHALEGDKERILNAGLDHYMAKPIKKAVIEGHVSRVAEKLRVKEAGKAPD